MARPTKLGPQTWRLMQSERSFGQLEIACRKHQQLLGHAWITTPLSESEAPLG